MPGRRQQARAGAQHGTARALLANMIEGVTAGYKKSLEIQGVGYKAEAKGKNLVLSVGFANPVTLTVPAGVEMKLEGVNEDPPDRQRTSSWSASSPATSAASASPSRTRARASGTRARRSRPSRARRLPVPGPSSELTTVNCGVETGFVTLGFVTLGSVTLADAA